MNTPKPTATISVPVRFCGRRVQPIRPAKMNDQLTNSTERSRDCRGAARGHSSGRQRDGERAGDQRSRAEVEPGAPGKRHAMSRAAIAAPDRSAFGTKPQAPHTLMQRPVVGSVAARGEDDRGRVDQPAKLLGDLEAVDVRQLHVEENEVRAEALAPLAGRRPRSRLRRRPGTPRPRGASGRWPGSWGGRRRSALSCPQSRPPQASAEYG